MYKNTLYALRCNKKLSRKDVANILEIDRTTYSHYESEDDIIPIKHFVALADHYNVSLDFIFSFTKIERYDNLDKGYNISESSKRLKALRKESKLTQLKLGEILACSYGTIAGYEAGRYLIATPFLYDICKKYNISADYLLGRIDEPKYLN